MSTRIPYLDETWNPITGCSGKGCKCHTTCWARDRVNRFPWIHGYPKIGEDQIVNALTGKRVCVPFYDTKPANFSQVQFHPDRLDKPLHWRKPRRIGVCFMGDLFDDQMKAGIVEWEKVYTVIDAMNIAPQHQYFILTKQSRNMLEFYQEWMRLTDKTSHINWGISITDQDDLDRMMPDLLRVPGKHWISYEPALGPVDLIHALDYWDGDTVPAVVGLRKYISWLVIGCESGPRRRPCPLEWVRFVVDQCRWAKVPCYVKQLDINGKVSHNPEEWPEDLRVRELT